MEILTCLVDIAILLSMGKCTICSSSHTHVYKGNVTSVYSDDTYNLIKCTRCENIFTSPLPTMEQLNYIYNARYFYDVHFLIQGEKEYRAKKLAKYIFTITGANKILEVGSMFGHLLEELKTRHIQCTGVEINKTAFEYCTKKNLAVINSTLEEFLKNNTEQYDVVIMSHALEHILNPKEQLKTLKNVLNKNGKLIVVVPNSLSLTAKLFGKFWGYWQVPVHINHFNRYSIRYLLENVGYEIIYIRTKGADSLLFLSTISNILNLKSGKLKLDNFKNNIIKLYSFFVKYWHIFGNEDLIIVAQKL